MKQNKKSRTSTILLCVSGFLIISIPFTRLLEAILRSIFMKEYYGSFAEALKKDVWFSAGWMEYVKTPLGLSMTLLPLVFILAALACFLLAAKSKSTPKPE